MIEEPWVVRVVGMIPLAHGISSEAIFGPFTTIDEAAAWAEAHRPNWAPVVSVQVITLTAPLSQPEPS